MAYPIYNIEAKLTEIFHSFMKLTEKTEETPSDDLSIYQPLAQEDVVFTNKEINETTKISDENVVSKSELDICKLKIEEKLQIDQKAEQIRTKNEFEIQLQSQKVKFEAIINKIKEDHNVELHKYNKSLEEKYEKETNQRIKNELLKQKHELQSDSEIRENKLKQHYECQIETLKKQFLENYQKQKIYFEKSLKELANENEILQQKNNENIKNFQEIFNEFQEERERIHAFINQTFGDT